MKYFFIYDDEGVVISHGEAETSTPHTNSNILIVKMTKEQYEKKLQKKLIVVDEKIEIFKEEEKEIEKISKKIKEGNASLEDIQKYITEKDNL